MSLPIKPTPRLYGKVAEDFLKEMKKNEQLPKIKLVYPNLDEVTELIKKDNI